LADRVRELTGPAAGMAAEDHLERLPLLHVGALVDVDPHRRARLTRPDVALERTERDDVQVVERDVAVAPFAHVPRHDALTIALARSLRECARTGSRAVAHVEPVAFEMPVGNFGHGSSLLSICPQRHSRTV